MMSGAIVFNVVSKLSSLSEFYAIFQECPHSLYPAFLPSSVSRDHLKAILNAEICDPRVHFHWLLQPRLQWRDRCACCLVCGTPQHSQNFGLAHPEDAHGFWAADATNAQTIWTQGCSVSKWFETMFSSQPHLAGKGLSYCCGLTCLCLQKRTVKEQLQRVCAAFASAHDAFCAQFPSEFTQTQTDSIFKSLLGVFKKLTLIVQMSS